MRSLIIVFICCTVILMACSRRISPPTSDRPAQIETNTRPVADPGKVMALPTQPRRPALDREPAIGVFLNQGNSLTFTLLQTAVLEGDSPATVEPGVMTATSTQGGIKIDRFPGKIFGQHVVFTVKGSGSRANFSSLTTSRNGKSETLTLSGSPELHYDVASCKVQLIERIGLETYLVGVVVKEVAASWPAEALKAQAIVARSYACDRFLQRWQQPWQLHWHHSVDMAYAGWSPSATAAQAAVAATRGELLLYHDLPLPALFHACSGGRTALISELKPDLTLCDGLTDPAPAMSATDDTAAKDGAKGLNLATHWQWTMNKSLNEVETSLRLWTTQHQPSHPTVGGIKSVRIAEKSVASGRATMVAITHRPGGKEEVLHISANEFRLALGPSALRSTLWTACEVKKGKLHIEGRGYGHGVGLSQVSAWYLAKTGHLAKDIARRFYPGASLARKW